MKLRVLGCFILIFLFGCTLSKARVSFDSHGGSDLEIVEVSIGSTISEPTAPTKPGYEFKGWFSDSTYNVPYDFSEMVEGDMTLHAKWEIGQYTIRFENFDGTYLDTQTFEYNEPIVDLQVPEPSEHDDYLFFGWNIDLPATMPDHDIIIKGRFVAQYQKTSGENDRDGFGSRILDNYPYYVVSSPNYDNENGAVFIYRFDDVDYQRTLHGSDYSESNFGEKMIIDGDYLFVSAPYQGVNDLGAIYVYRFSQESYEQLLQPDDLLEDTRFGWNFAVEDDKLLVGIYASANPTVYLYEQTTEWELSRSIPCPDCTDDSRYGQTVGINGDYLVVNSFTPNQQGFLYVFKASDPTYERKLSDPSSGEYDYYGARFEIHDPYLVVSAYGAYEGVGALYLYRFDDPLYLRIINSEISQTLFNMGPMFAIEDNYLVVPTTISPDGEIMEGAIFVFKFDDDTYNRMITHDHFGSLYDSGFVKILGDYIIVYDITYDGYKGQVFLFRFSDELYERRILGSNTTEGSGFGLNVLLIEDDLFISAPGVRQKTTGSIYQYKLSDETYEHEIYQYNVREEDSGYLSARVLYFEPYFIITDVNSTYGSGILYYYDYSEITDDD